MWTTVTQTNVRPVSETRCDARRSPAGLASPGLDGLSHPTPRVADNALAADDASPRPPRASLPTTPQPAIYSHLFEKQDIQGPECEDRPWRTVAIIRRLLVAPPPGADRGANQPPCRYGIIQDRGAPCSSAELPAAAPDIGRGMGPYEIVQAPAAINQQMLAAGGDQINLGRLTTQLDR